MQYALRQDGTGGPASSAELPDNFAAEAWAKKWARENAKADAYVLERTGGGFRMRLFRTVGGQWYLTPH